MKPNSSLDERAADVPIGNLPGEVAQRPCGTLQLVIAGIGVFKAGAELGAQRFPVDALVLGEGVFVGQLVNQGVKRGGVVQSE
jgi:hypothetical protein